MFRFLLIGIALFCNTISINAQDYELGKVTIEELLEKAHPKDSSASAAILFKKGKTHFGYKADGGFFAYHECEVKIKIYKTEGLKWANQKIRFYIGYENLNSDKLEFSNAVTYNLENGTIVQTKLDNQGEFKNKINEYWKEKTITLPNVKVGSVIEYKYVLTTENIIKFPDFDVQYEIPLNHFYYKTEIPEFYIYKPISIGGIMIQSDAKFKEASKSYVNFGQRNTLYYKQIESFYTGKDVPALKEEPYISNIENYRGQIKHELEIIRLPERPIRDLTITWEGVAKTIFENENFGKQLGKNNFIPNDLKKTFMLVEDKNDRLNLVFKYVQNFMNWDENDGYYVDKGVVKAYKDQTGNVAEINFILISMLRSAGIEANPVLVSTIQNGLPVFPTRTGFNYVIAAAEIDGKQVLLDATRKYTLPNILPFSVLNWKGRLIKKDGTSQEIELDPSTPSKENYNLMVKIDPDGIVSGKVAIQRTDYNAYQFRIENAEKKEESYLDKIETEWGNAEISDYKVENLKTNIKDPVVENFSFSSNNALEIIGGKIFMKPLLFFTTDKNPFKQEERKMPIYFGYKNQERFNLSIEIPKGYVVESTPKPVKIVSEEKRMIFSFNISVIDNKIQILSIKEINNSTFATEDYEMIKEVFEKIVLSQNQKIVLKKA